MLCMRQSVPVSWARVEKDQLICRGSIDIDHGWMGLANGRRVSIAPVVMQLAHISAAIPHAANTARSSIAEQTRPSAWSIKIVDSGNHGLYVITGTKISHALSSTGSQD